MTDLNERPAVPPQDLGADERYGGFAAGGLLIALGWGVGLALNVLVHRIAPSDGLAFGPFRIFPALGPFAIATAALGAVTGVIGAVLIGYAAGSPKGPFVLPGQSYDS